MRSFQVISLLEPMSDSESHDDESAMGKLASLLDSDSGDKDVEVDETDALKTASVMEKLGRALESGQAKLDLDLRDLFGGEETDEDIGRHNQLEDEYLKVTGQPGV